MDKLNSKKIAYISIFSALGVVLVLLTLFPMGPNIYLDLSHVGTSLSAILLGPVAGGITGLIVGLYPGFTFSNILVPPFKAMTGIFIAILSKKTRPGIAVFVGYLPEGFLTFFTLSVMKFPYGLPWPVVSSILIKAFIEIIAISILMEIIMRNKGLQHFYFRNVKLEDKKKDSNSDVAENKSKEKEKIKDNRKNIEYPQEIQKILLLFELDPKEKYTLKDIKEQKRYLSNIYHPDKNTNLSEKSKLKAENELKKINDNYDKLSKFFK